MKARRGAWVACVVGLAACHRRAPVEPGERVRNVSSKYTAEQAETAATEKAPAARACEEAPLKRAEALLRIRKKKGAAERLAKALVLVGQACAGEAPDDRARSVVERVGRPVWLTKARKIWADKAEQAAVSGDAAGFVQALRSRYKVDAEDAAARYIARLARRGEDVASRVRFVPPR